MTTAPSPRSPPEPLPLAGFTVGVTAARRAEELGALLERRGAKVVHGPAIRIVPLADDTDLRAATQELINHPPDIVVMTTGMQHAQQSPRAAAVVDGVLRAVAPTPMVLLRLLATRPGRVLPRAQSLSVMPTARDDEHAVETAAARLRAALGYPGMVQTVVKRGYRLALDPEDCR
jgi:Transcriptional regulatory protein, C terminal/Uroporphyrinogen-III synthase HemD